MSGTEPQVPSSRSHRLGESGSSRLGIEEPLFVLAISWRVEPEPHWSLRRPWDEGRVGRMELSPHPYALFRSKSRWSNPITLKMKGWGWLALLLGVLLGTAWARRSQDLHCGGKDTKKWEEGGWGRQSWEDVSSKAWVKWMETGWFLSPFPPPPPSLPCTSLQSSGGWTRVGNCPGGSQEDHSDGLFPNQSRWQPVSGGGNLLFPQIK